MTTLKHASKVMALTLAVLYLGQATAQQNTAIPQQIPQDPLGIGKGVSANLITQLPPQLQEHARKHEVDMRTKGYVDASDQEIGYIKNYRRLIKPLSDIQGNLKLKLSSFDESSFAFLKLEGVVPEGPSPSGPWTSLSRVYTIPNGAIIRLMEWDYVADGGGINFQKEMFNETIQGKYSAILSIKQSAKGEALSTLTWATDKKYYVLTMTGHVRGNGMYKQFLSLANSIRD